MTEVHRVSCKEGEWGSRFYVCMCGITFDGDRDRYPLSIVNRISNAHDEPVGIVIEHDPWQHAHQAHPEYSYCMSEIGSPDTRQIILQGFIPNQYASVEYPESASTHIFWMKRKDEEMRVVEDGETRLTASPESTSARLEAHQWRPAPACEAREGNSIRIPSTGEEGRAGSSAATVTKGPPVKGGGKGLNRHEDGFSSYK